MQDTSPDIPDRAPEQAPKRGFFRRKPKAPDNRPRWKVLVQDWLRPLVIALLILTPIRSSVADWNDVPSGSMKPTILVGDRIFVNKLAYGLRVPLTKTWVGRWAAPEPGDIVICHNPNSGQRLVKRVVAVGGDLVTVRRGELYVNGSRPPRHVLGEEVINWIAEDDQIGRDFYAEDLGDGETHPVMRTPGMGMLFRPPDVPPLRVPEGSVYVMGDNREQSSDSRVFGVISLDEVVGKVGRVVASVDPDNYFMPRFERFFMPLR